MTISKNYSYKSAQFLQKSWQFHNLLPQNVVNFLEFFPKVPLTLLLGTFFSSKMAKRRHQKKSMIATNATSPPKKRLDTQVRASPAILLLCVSLPITIGWRKIKTYRLGSAKCFDRAFLQSFLRLVQALKKFVHIPPENSVINYDLTTSPYFKRLANHNDWSWWFAISDLPPICACWRQIKSWSGCIWSRRWRPPAVAAVAMQAPRFTWLTVMPSPCSRG